MRETNTPVLPSCWYCTLPFYRRCGEQGARLEGVLQLSPRDHAVAIQIGAAPDFVGQLFPSHDAIVIPIRGVKKALETQA
jgi:hypothetical protein